MSAKKEIEVLINRSREAQKQIENYTQEQVDELIKAMVWSVARPGMAEEIAQFTVDETQLGNYDGKFLKIQRKTRATLMDIIDDKYQPHGLRKLMLLILCQVLVIKIFSPELGFQ